MATVKLIACTHPLKMDERVEQEFGLGLTLRDMLEQVGMVEKPGLSLRVTVNSVPTTDLDRIPPAGSVVTARIVPENPVQIAIAVIIVVGTFFAVRQISKLSDFDDVSTDRLLSPTLRGAQNDIRPFAPVPILFGKHRITPMLGAKAFTEVHGNETFLKMIVVPTLGPVTMESADFKIGETLLSTFDDVETEIRLGHPGEPKLNLITQEVDEIDPGVKFKPTSQFTAEPNPTAYVTRTTTVETEEISLGFFFPQGIIITDSHGGNHPAVMRFEIQKKLLPGGSFVAATPLDVTSQPDTREATELGNGIVEFAGTTRNQLRRSVRFTVTKGQYDVRVRRYLTNLAGRGLGPVTATDLGSQSPSSEWNVFRSSRALDPIKLDGVAKVALRIKATDQLSGVIKDFSVLAESRHPVYDPSNPLADAAGFVANVRTRNPAWHYLDVLRGRGNKTPIADTNIDLVAFQNWAATADLNGWTFDGVFDFDTTVLQALNMIARAGRASFNISDGKFSIVQNQKQTAIVQQFTPRNSFGFKGTKLYADQPDALRIRFLNENEDYKVDELIVYADGFDATNAQKFEQRDFFGITNPEKAWEHGRFEQAVELNRNEEFELNTDFEYLVCQRGDLVLITHDVALIGLAFGRIKSLTVDGGSNVTTITLDQEVTFEDGKTYGVRIRSLDTSDAPTFTQQTTTNPATGGPDVTQTLITLSAAIPVAKGVAVGNLVSFGEDTDETEEMIVKRIEPQEDLTAVLTLMPHAPSIFTADAGPIPLHEPVITIGPNDRPPEPVIDGIEAIDGQFMLSVRVPAGGTVAAAQYEVSFRIAEPVGPWAFLAPVSVTIDRIAVAPVVQDERYDIRVRTVSASGLTSDFVQLSNVLFDGNVVFSGEFKITGLQLLNQGNVTEFEGPTAFFSWRLNSPDLSNDPIQGTPVNVFDTVAHPSFRTFEVRVSDAVTGAVLRTEEVQKQSYDYTFDKNKEDKGLRRTFTFDVGVKDIAEKVGPRSSLTVSNPAPRKHLTVNIGEAGYSILSTLETVYASFIRPQDPDYVGTLMFMKSTTFGSDDPTTADLVNEVTGSPALASATSGTTQFVKIASYDEFAQDPTTGLVDLTLLNFSDELSVLVQDIGEDILDNLIVSQFVESTVVTPIAPFFGTRGVKDENNDLTFLKGLHLQDVWGEIDSVDITVVSTGKVLIGSGFFLHVSHIEQDPADRKPILEFDLTGFTSGMASPKVKWRMVRNPQVQIDFTAAQTGLPYTADETVTWGSEGGTGKFVANDTGAKVLTITHTGGPDPRVGDTISGSSAATVMSGITHIGTVLYESEIMTISAEGLFAGGSFSGLDVPGIGQHTYAMQLKWALNQYRTGQAKTMDSPAPSPFGRNIIGDSSVNWEWLVPDSDAAIGYAARFRWSDEDEGLGIQITEASSQTNALFLDKAARTETAFRDYIIDITIGAAGLDQHLQLDITKSLLIASEFRK